VRPGLFFIPAFKPSDQDRFSLDLNPSNKNELLARLDKKLNMLLRNFDIDLIMLDCHGGLDTVSFASFALSDHTIVVSEPDKITFNGTLELLDYYEKNWIDQSSCGPSDDNTMVSGEGRLPALSGDSIPTDKVIFLLNRVSGYFSYDGLTKLYRSEIMATSSFAAQVIGPYIFIPSDTLLAQSVSQYPIYAELVPESLFCQKLELIYVQLFGKRPTVIGRSALYRLFERKRARSLQRQLRSIEERRTAAVYAFITMAQVGMLLGITWLAFGVAHVDPAEVKTGHSDFVNHPILFGIGGVLLSIGLLGTSWVNVVVSKYYRDVLRLEYRLFRRNRRLIVAIVLLRLIRLSGARLYLLLSATFFALLGAIYLVLAVGVLWRG
jgi:MinD-like ATPase involved in chromosome partitioning or flagellar assembly